MSFLTPLFLLLALLAGPIIVMYMLRLRRREMLVSSTLLWRKLLRDRQANAPWQRLRRNLLLILQLIILGALVLALARPFLPVPSVVSGSVVVLLDASASMQATDVSPSRFAAATEAVGQLIDNLGGGDQMTLIAVGRTPRVLLAASGDRRQLRDALAGAAPTAAAADWPAALALAAGAAQGFREARIVVVSDGGLSGSLPPLPADVVYLPIGASGENLALSALATRAAAAGPPELFASVTNYGRIDRTALLSLELDGVLHDSRRISVPAGQSTSVTWSLPDGAGLIAARLGELEEDYLPLDDVAWAVHEGGVTNRVLVVTPGNRFLEQAYSVLPGVDAFTVGPTTDLAALAEPFDLYVLDSVPLPAPLPDGALLIINPLPGAAQSRPDAPLAVTGVLTDTPAIAAVRVADSPLLEFVDWSGVNVRQAQQVTAPGLQTLVGAEQGALILAGEHNGRRLAVITFRLQDSDLPLQIAFPILIANLTNWLSPGRAFDAPHGLRTGDPLAIVPGAGTTAVLVERPGGESWIGPVTGGGQIIFGDTEQTGLYHVGLRENAGDRPAGSFAVNLFAPRESNILPAAELPIGPGATGAAAADAVGQRELWPWLALVAALVLLVEWWVYHRGTDLEPLRRWLPRRNRPAG